MLGVWSLPPICTPWMQLYPQGHLNTWDVAAEGVGSSQSFHCGLNETCPHKLICWALSC